MQINLTGPASNLGYGYAVQYILYELSKNNTVSFFPIGQPQPEKKFHECIKKSLENAVFFNTKAPSLRIWHQFDLAQHVGKIKIGYPFFELDKFTPREKHHLESCDYIFTASEWGRQIVINETNLTEDRVFNVPLGVDTSIFYPKNKIIDDTTKFINIGKIEIRKGHGELIEAFNKAFELDDNVELYMMWDNPFLNEKQTNEWIRYYKNSKLGPKIKFIPRVATHQELAHIINQIDIGIFPFKAEGFNLDLLEVMACGKLVISTNYSGSTEFLTPFNSFLLEPNGMETAYDGIWFTSGIGSWVTINIDELVELMRQAHNNKQFNQAGVDTAKKYTWKNTAMTIESILKEL